MLGNLRDNPSNLKFGNLNHDKIAQKLTNCRPALSLLFTAGFARSADGERLKWKNTPSNQKLVTKIIRAIQKKEHLLRHSAASASHRDSGVALPLKEANYTVPDSGCKDEAIRKDEEEAIKMNVNTEQATDYAYEEPSKPSERKVKVDNPPNTADVDLNVLRGTHSQCSIGSSKQNDILGSCSHLTRFITAMRYHELLTTLTGPLTGNSLFAELCAES